MGAKISEEERLYNEKVEELHKLERKATDLDEEMLRNIKEVSSHQNMELLLSQIVEYQENIQKVEKEIESLEKILKLHTETYNRIMC